MRRLAKAAAAVAVAGMAGLLPATAHAQDGARVIHGQRAQEVQVREDGSRVRVVVRQVVAPAAMVDRALAEQPVHPHLIEVRVVHTTIYLDPLEDYQRKNEGVLDDNHFIVRAQRLARSLRADARPRVIHGTPAEPQAAAEADVQPRAIIYMPRQDRPRRQGPIPAVPRQTDERPPLMASAQ